MCYLPFKIQMSNPFNGVITAIKKYMNLEPETEIEMREIVIIDTQPTKTSYEKPNKCLNPNEIDVTIKFYDNVYLEFDMIESIDS